MWPTEPFKNRMAGADIAASIGDSILKKCGNIRGVHVLAHRGDTIDDLRHHVMYGYDSRIVRNKKIIFLHAGTNDIINSTVEEMIGDVTRLVRAVEYRSGANPKIFFSSIIPRPKDFWTTQNKIMTFNKELQRKEAEIGVEYIRTWHLFSRKGLPRKFMYNTDNLHPSDKGFKRLSRFISKVINTYRKEVRIPKVKRTATRSRVTRKPDAGYGYAGQRNRTRILFDNGDHPPEPTYGSEIKDVHKPRPEGEPKPTLRMKKKLRKEQEKQKLKSTVHLMDNRIVTPRNGNQTPMEVKKQQRRNERRLAKKQRKREGKENTGE